MFICIILWCCKIDGSGQCELVVGVDGFQCGNRKVYIYGIYNEYIYIKFKLNNGNFLKFIYVLYVYFCKY